MDSFEVLSLRRFVAPVLTYLILVTVRGLSRFPCRGQEPRSWRSMMTKPLAARQLDDVDAGGLPARYGIATVPEVAICSFQFEISEYFVVSS